MKVSDVTGLIQSFGEANLNPNDDSQSDEKIKEAFKTIFVEQMIGQLMKTGNLVSGTNGLQKELMEEQLKESLSQYFMDGAGIRWNEVLGLSEKEVKGKDNGSDKR